MAQPKLPDYETAQAMRNVLAAPYKEYWKRLLRINDEQLAIRRFKYFGNLPGLDYDLLERILYYRGECAVFYSPELDKMMTLPFCLEGDIDIYGRYKLVRMLPFTGISLDDDKKKALNIIREPVYDLLEEIDPIDFCEHKCIIVRDYVQQISQKVQPRQKLNDGLIDMESNIPCYANTLLSNSVGITGVRVMGDDEAMSVKRASQTAQDAAINGEKFLAMNGTMDWQDLTTKSAGTAEEFLMVLQSFDNMRLASMGLRTGGIFEKNGTRLNNELAFNDGHSNLVMEDCLKQREDMCDKLNKFLCGPLGFNLVNVVCNDTMGDMTEAIMKDRKEGTGEAQEAPINAQQEGGYTNEQGND